MDDLRQIFILPSPDEHVQAKREKGRKKSKKGESKKRSFPGLINNTDALEMWRISSEGDVALGHEDLNPERQQMFSDPPLTGLPTAGGLQDVGMPVDEPPIGRPGTPVGEHSLPVGEHGLAVSEHGLPVGEHGLPVGEHGLPVGGHSLPVGKHGLPVGEHGLPVGEHGLPVGEHGLPVGEDGLPVGEDGLPVGEHGLPVGEHGVPVGEHGLPVGPKENDGSSTASGEDVEDKPEDIEVTQQTSDSNSKGWKSKTERKTKKGKKSKW